MGKENTFGRQEASRYESMNRTRNAFTGEKNKYDLKARALGNSKEKPEVFSKEDNKFLDELAGKNANLKRKELESLLQFSRLATQQTIQRELNSQRYLTRLDAELELSHKINEAAKNKIRARIEQRAIAAKAQKEEAKKDRPMSEWELTAAIWKLQIEAMAKPFKKIEDFAFAIIDRLPNGILRFVPLAVLFILVLAACSAAPTPKPDAANPSTPQAGEVTAAPVGATEAAVATVQATGTATATAEPSPTATEKAMTLKEKVDAFAAGKIEFPANMSPEEYSAFIDEMNNHVGRKAIWVESFDNKTKAPVVLYFNITKNNMVKLPGTYAENKAIIDQNALEMFVKINVEPGTGNLQYIDTSGKLVTSPNSAGVDWNLRVDKTNYEIGLIDLPEVIGKGAGDANTYWKRAFELNAEFVFIPGILMDDTVSRVVSNQGGWSEYPCLDILFVKTDAAGNPTYGIRTMDGPAPSTYLGNEGETLDVDSSLELRSTDMIKKFEAGAVHYVSVPKQQQLVWDQYNLASIDELQDTGSAANSSNNALNQRMPGDGNIILAAPIFIKKQ